MIFLTQSLSANELGKLTGIIIIIVLIVKLVRYANGKPTYRYTKTNNTNKSNHNIKFEKSYQPKYLMTLNEKEQYIKIKDWADTKGLNVFTKVRLLDLIEPRKNQNNYNTRLWKIQAKHVDFVVCDKDIKVKCIIEINDSSHNRLDRMERDKFVRTILEDCGYKLLQTYNITSEELDKICGYNISTTEEQNQP